MLRRTPGSPRIHMGGAPFHPEGYPVNPVILSKQTSMNDQVIPALSRARISDT